jgi:hypothetical protein
MISPRNAPQITGISIETVLLRNGVRLLRASDKQSGIFIEKELKAGKSVRCQSDELLVALAEARREEERIMRRLLAGDKTGPE